MTAPKARLFFALWPDERTRAEFNEWLRLLGSAIEGRATRPESLHLTIVFLGDVELDRLDALNSIARKMEGDRFELAFDAAEYWRHNRIVHAIPVEAPEALKNLVAVLERELREAGFSFDQRTYIPHMTLMRRARWRELKLKFGRVNWPVNDFALVRSHSQARGSQYEVLGKWQLSSTPSTLAGDVSPLSLPSTGEGLGRG
ncbi:MAG: RNA 2',3'-cyclic phosphodiesterase [Burkholderiales bacterium]